MLKGEAVALRLVRDDDLPLLERWMADPAAAAGSYQRYQLEHGRALTHLFHQNGLVTRDSGFLIIQLLAEDKPIGFVRYATQDFPDPDVLSMDIGYGIAEVEYRGYGYATEAVGLLLDYLFANYPVERVGAVTDSENTPSCRLLERLGFMREGTLRRAMFRGGAWRDVALYGILREEWKGTTMTILRRKEGHGHP